MRRRGNPEAWRVAYRITANEEREDLVKEGWCWWYRKYAPGNTVLEGLEKEAREAKKGLWADPAHVPPWEWRKGSKRVKE